MPVEAMVLGKSREEVAELLPRLFNLCRAAQAMAVRRALGLPGADDTDALRGEILRDHVLRLSVVLPGHFGQPPSGLPAGWQDGGTAMRQALFGPAGQLPETLDAFDAYLAAGTGLADLFQRIDDLFGPGEAVAEALPLVAPETAGQPDALVENSCAARVADHPVVADFARRTGRGPLWRVVARAYDLQALLDGAPLTLAAPEPGIAQVSATRGLYTVTARTDGTRVTAFSRVTPTDHLRAKGGVLDQSLASLPADRAGLAPLLIDILDPCSPVRVTELPMTEGTHA